MPLGGMMRELLGAFLFGILTSAAQAAEIRIPDYVGTGACVDCHEDQARAWTGSHHDWAWTLPGPDTVLGDFDNAEFEHHGEVTRFFREGERYLVETGAVDGQRGTWEVVGVVGITPLQQYLLSPEAGRLQTLDVAWDTLENRWFAVFPDQDIGLNDGLHWSGPYKSWEARCAECHATGYSRNYDTQARNYAPRKAEIGVGCEACHGPGAAHLEWATTWAEDGADAADAGIWPGMEAAGFPLAFSRSDPEAEIQQCAACHSRREAFSDGNPLPGTQYHDAYNLSLLRDGLYHADGTILEEVYVYGSFLQSKMYREGVRCSDCHDPHAGELRAERNAVCTQCHNPAGNERFPTLVKDDYDAQEHHFHEEGSEGAQCISCHMTERIYMGVDARSDHSFRIPRPDLAAGTGAPDTCTDCHADRDPDWAAAAIAEWYPDSDNRGPHHVTTFAAGRLAPMGQATALLELARDREGAGIVRASALELLQPVADAAIAAESAALMDDPDPLVRAAAAALQRGLPPEARVASLQSALGDPVRTVRVAAARALLDVPEAATDPAMRAAMGEWRSALMANADFPETHLVIGGIGLTSRNFGLASQAFREAVTLDPQLLDAWRMLVRIAAATNDRDGALAALEEAEAANPGSLVLEDLRRELGLPPADG